MKIHKVSSQKPGKSLVVVAPFPRQRATNTDRLPHGYLNWPLLQQCRLEAGGALLRHHLIHWPAMRVKTGMFILWGRRWIFIHESLSMKFATTITTNNLIINSTFCCLSYWLFVWLCMCLHMVFAVYSVYVVLFSSYGAAALLGPGPPHYWGSKITLRHTTLGRTSLEDWSARPRDLCLTL